MKKEIEITFEKYEINNEKLLGIDIVGNELELDNFVLKSDAVSVGMSDCCMGMLGISEHTLESYLSIPEIKELYDERFKKEVDLFCYNVEKVFYVDRCGTIENLRVKNPEFHDLIDDLKNNFNLFPTKELAEKARPMSLDERKQFLFAIAKGYEVFTLDEALRLDESVWRDAKSLIKNRNGSYDINYKVGDFTSNIYFKEEKHAEEYVNFMNETKEVSE